ncbi:T-box transcription factor tbx20 [Podila minutissima]|nr:T-box transcription factor tbx20 [Podila minutissima]
MIKLCGKKTKAPDNDSQASAEKDKTEATRRNRFQRPKLNASSNNTRASSPSLESLPNSERSTPTNSRSLSASDPHLTLVDRSLWSKFDAIENEMIVTQTGRSIFPYLKFRVSNLDPDSLYAIAVQIEQMDPKKHRYANNGRWQVDDRQIKGPAAVFDQHWYYHPGSYSSGKVLMSDVISFENIRISNKTPDSKTSRSCNSHIFLVSSFRKYRPRIRLLKYSQHDSSKSIGSWLFMFEETSFFAVTHYQNGAVNRLKTDHNPHAKAFRLSTWKPKSKSKGKSKGKRTVKGENNEEPDTSENDTYTAPVRKKIRKVSPKRPVRRVKKSSQAVTKTVAKRVKSETEEELEGDDEYDDEDTEQEPRENSGNSLGQGNTEESNTDDEGSPIATSSTSASATRTRNSTKTTTSLAPNTSGRLGLSDDRARLLTRSRSQSRVSVHLLHDMISEDEEDESDELESLNKRDRSFVARLKVRLTSTLDDDPPSSDSPLDLSNSPTLSPYPSDLEVSLESGTEEPSGEDSGEVEDDDLSDDGYWRKKEQSTSSCSTVRPSTPGDESLRIGSSSRAQGSIWISKSTGGSSRSISKTPLESRNRNLEYQSTEPYGDYSQYHGYSSWNGYRYGAAPSTTIPYSHMIESTGNYNQVYTSDSSPLTLKLRRRGATVPESNILYAPGAPLLFSDQVSSTYDLHGDMGSHVLLPAPIAMPATLPPHPESVLYAPSREPSHFQEIEPVAGATMLASPVRSHSPVQFPSPPHASVTWYQQFFVWDQPSPPVPNDDIPEPSAAAQPPTSSFTLVQPPLVASSAARTRTRHGQKATEASDTETTNVEPAFSDGPLDVITAIIREPQVTLTTLPALVPSIYVGSNGSASSRREEVQNELICDEQHGFQESPKITPLRDHSPEESSQSEASHLRYSNSGLTESQRKDNTTHILRQVPQKREIVTERHGIVHHRRFFYTLVDEDN